MSDADEPELIEARSRGWLAITPWLGWLFGPMAWALHQGIGYAMVPWLCTIGTRWPYHALTGVALLLCAAGITAALEARRRSRRVYPERSAERLNMMALVGLMLSAAALFGITVEYAGSFWLSPCTNVDP
jgi:hypothetical protein